MSEKHRLVIIGSGPAGYTAAIYAARAELKPLVLAGESYGGQLVNTTLVENWPGEKDGVMGPDLMIEMRAQAEKFGAEMVDKFATKVDFSDGVKKVWVGDGEYQAEAVIVATGAKSIMLGVPGEDRLLGRGVATCAVCDAAFYRDKVTYVVGGGDAAIEDAMALTKFASRVIMLVRRDEFRASKIMAERAKNHEKIEIWWNTELKEVVGEQKLEKIKVMNNKTNEQREEQADGVFYAIGHKPVTGMFEGKLELDLKGYLLTGLNGLVDKRGDHRDSKETEGTEGVEQELWLGGYPTMTSVEGVFGAGDVVDFRYRQAVTAAGMGCQAALDAEKWLERGES